MKDFKFYTVQTDMVLDLTEYESKSMQEIVVDIIMIIEEVIK